MGEGSCAETHLSPLDAEPLSDTHCVPQLLHTCWALGTGDIVGWLQTSQQRPAQVSRAWSQCPPPELSACECTCMWVNVCVCMFSS